MQPLFGQFCNVFGRRIVTLSAIATFVLGSGLCGGASSARMLIAGRAVQGAGSGGIVLVTSIVISDLVPLRQRGAFSAIVMALLGLGTALGPFIGGAIVSTTSWRWCFYLNLPIGAVSFVWLFFLLQHTDQGSDDAERPSFLSRLRRIDWVGNALIIPSTVSLLYALSYAGTRYAWDAWQTFVPLLVGAGGLALFAVLQVWAIADEPLMPARFFNTPTPAIICVNTFIASALLYWTMFFLPIYFQGVKLFSPRLSGVAMLPFALLGIPGAMFGGIALVRWGRYKPIHIVAFALQTLGLGLFSMQSEKTSNAAWAIFQCLFSPGGGLIFTTMLPAFQAFFHQQDLAGCTASWYFIRMFGQIWGVAIPSAIFNNRVDQLLSQGYVSSSDAVELLQHGGAFQSASQVFVQQWPEPVQDEIRALYRLAFQRIFQVAIAFAGVGFLLSLFEKEVALRKTLDTKYGLKEKQEIARSNSGNEA